MGLSIQDHITATDSAQKKVVRLIECAQKQAHTAPLFRDLKIKPLLEEIEYRRALLAYEVVKMPHKHSVTLTDNFEHDHHTRFRSDNIPIPRKYTRNFGTMGIESLLVKAYNDLPIIIKNLESGKYGLLKHLLKQHFSRSTINE